MPRAITLQDMRSAARDTRISTAYACDPIQTELVDRGRISHVNASQPVIASGTQPPPAKAGGLKYDS